MILLLLVSLEYSTLNNGREEEIGNNDLMVSDLFTLLED